MTRLFGKLREISHPTLLLPRDFRGRLEGRKCPKKEEEKFKMKTINFTDKNIRGIRVYTPGAQEPKKFTAHENVTIEYGDILNVLYGALPNHRFHMHSYLVHMNGFCELLENMEDEILRYLEGYVMFENISKIGRKASKNKPGPGERAEGGK